ncbi:MAG TPA: beta-N-acetylhexosaminidase [Longimicrobiaceae bacterium]|nr:beta-N-acetylhexosaminidase [Longimicrobiaceae bacterium]
MTGICAATGARGASATHSPRSKRAAHPFGTGNSLTLPTPSRDKVGSFRSCGRRRFRSRALLSALALLVLGGCDALARIGPLGSDAESPYAAIIPQPRLTERARDGGHFELSEATVIHLADPELEPAAELLATTLRRSTGFALPVRPAADAPAGGIYFRRSSRSDPGEEGYALQVTPSRITVEAATVVGAVWGAQTLRQLFPAHVERREPQPGRWRVPAGEVVDSPRYPWRGAMLDVARHFSTVAEVERFIDVLSYYKMNRLHLHLTDDQGWRLMIESWPKLALHGGSLAVGGAPGGFYTQAEYRRLVRYAEARGVTIVPEIEMPGHSHAAIASYPELGCLSDPPPLYTGIAVGFSAFCFRTDTIWTFVEDVIAEVAALTPGEYIHIGGDETYVVLEEHYQMFVPRVEGIIAAHGKRLIGWEEIGRTEVGPDAVVQFWDRPQRLQLAVDRGLEIIMSPSKHAYLDSKYNPRTPIGRTWTSEFLDVRKAYEWDPAELAPAGARVIGVEGPLWTETVREYREVEYLALPRLIGLAEIGWTQPTRSWESYRIRLGRHGRRLDAMGINYYRAPEVPWR